MKTILRYFRKYLPETILAPLFKFMEATLELLVPLVIASIIDRGIPAGDRAFILSRGGPDIAEFCRTQLGTRLPDPDRMRLSSCDEQGLRTLAFRTWRIRFSHEGDRISVRDIFSGYTPEELLPDAEDPVGDKELHREFEKNPYHQL